MKQRVKQWLDERTFDARTWAAGRPRAKEVFTRRDHTVSVVLPALNEAETIGAIVSTIRRQLVTELPVVDEIVVMDCDSTDGTVPVSRAAGAVTFSCAEVLPEIGRNTGKGDALWRSLYVTSGDIVVFIDSDLSDFSAGLVLGLLGPLLEHHDIALVKAAFDRDSIGDDASDIADDAPGGRLTELFARPLLGMHWPDLAGFVQPLSGQFAARRAVLERMPFCHGYGVDLALLIDVWRSEGLGALAQTDVGHLRHRNRGSSALGRAAAEILHACTSRLPPQQQVPAPRRDLVQFSRLRGVFMPLTNGLTVAEHLPMILNEDYVRRSAAPMPTR